MHQNSEENTSLNSEKPLYSNFRLTWKRLGWVFLLFPVLYIAIFSEGCRRLSIKNEGPLTFSGDTVKFDTIFTTIASPTERLMFYNPFGNASLRIDKIFLEGGDASDFELIIDGMEMDTITDYILAPGDSALIFVDFVSDAKDMLLTDNIVFEIDGEQQRVLIEAYVLDAYFYSDVILECDAVWDNSKKIVVDGIVLVDAGCVLTILPGTEIYFTAKKDTFFNLTSMIYVLGRLDVRGQEGAEVLFTSSRLEEGFFEQPSQWRGLHFAVPSQNNRIEHALIKNALWGIRVDSLSNNFNPKVRVRHTEIRNMAGYGIWTLGFAEGATALGPQVQVENSLIHNCQLATFAQQAGGNTEFYNCTFVNYSLDFSRDAGQLFFSNYYEDTSGAVFDISVNANFYNCIVWGSFEEELLLDTVNSGIEFDIRFQNCLLRTTLSFDPTFNLNNIFNLSPAFVDPKNTEEAERDYRITEESPARDAGKNLILFYNDDIDETPRDDGAFDIGAYEWIPEEE